MDRIKVERAIDGLAEWRKHVQTNSDIDRDISTAIEALKAQLFSEGTTKGTTSDTISRQAAIEAINSWRGRFSEEYNEAIDDCENSIKELPAAQPEERTEKRMETHACDLISRQAAIDALARIAREKFNLSDEYNHYLAGLMDGELAIKNLPTMQPEVLACGNGELVAKPEPTDIDAREAVYNLAEKIGIHQLYALTVELRGEPIQPEPKKGHWIEGKIYRDIIECNCSECGQLMTTVASVRMNYCPNCGAKMKGERQK